MTQAQAPNGASRQFPEGIVGRKVGMTQIFDEQGACIPVTVIEAGPCVVLEVRSAEKNGYAAVQLGFIEKKPQRVSKAELGHFAKVGKGAFYEVREIRCDVDKLGWKVGEEVRINDLFDSGELVDVSGVSKGKGFQGVMRRHHVKGQPFTRGTHEYRRHIGAIGCRKFPGRVFPNKRMPGHMGVDCVTVQNVQVVAIKPEDNVILIRGGIPGARGGIVEIKKAIKGYTGVKPRPKKSEEKTAQEAA